ncbi:antibiotic biosynthesis monooxygenase [Nocardioides euryhalodurans]|uniref:Antibiotic biosynthesis monooxygenase n=1 Tax=Nocardioides euryhalodurans TaxID=2518370 RepID=A0A4P7GPX3_9ACTN|nr:antibiotic biosynthesis monooxygenase [Nocardioides euryhalodurans]QBR93861.1 antibiotic biosynthesis monooxygenase [Nocardioides euryhalodurans]
MSSPVTVSITRHLDTDRSAEMTAWVRAGTALAGEFPGFLGAGWVQSGPDSREWHMLYRFADADALATWESSPQRAWWLGAAQDLGVVEARVERRTGIEGWFDEPTSRDVEERAPGVRPAPPRWKQATVIWLAFFPLSLLTTVALGAFVPDLHVALRVLTSTLLMTPVMTYLALPFMTARLAWWLHR